MFVPYLTLTAFLLLLAYSSFAQAPTIEWQKCLGGSLWDEDAKSIQQTSDGGYVMAGYSQSNNGDVSNNYGFQDCWIVKLGASGSLLWQKTFGGSRGDYANSIRQTNDGGFIIAGYTGSNDNDVAGNNGSYDFWVIKLDSYGNLLWQKPFGGSSDDYANSIQQTNDGGFIVAGFTASNDSDVNGNHGAYDLWIIKLDSSGTLLWQATFGGSNNDYANSVQQTNDGGYVVAGYTESNDGNVTVNNGYSDLWVIKLDASGTLEWQKSIGGSESEQALSVIQSNDEGYVLAGESSSPEFIGNNRMTDYWVVKLDSLSNMQWQKSFGGIDMDVARGIQQTSDGGYVVAGYTDSDDGNVSGNHGNYEGWIIKLDTSGNLQRQKPFGGSDMDEAFSIQQTNDGGYIVGGESSSNDGDVSGNHGRFDFWVVKLSSFTSLNEILSDSQKVKLYSFNKTLSIFLQENQQSNYTIEVINLMGKKVYSSDLSGSLTRLP